MLSNGEKIVVIEARVMDMMVELKGKFNLTDKECSMICTKTTLEFTREFGLTETLEDNPEITKELVDFMKEFDAISDTLHKNLKFPFKEGMDKDI